MEITFVIFNVICLIFAVSIVLSHLACPCEENAVIVSCNVVVAIILFNLIIGGLYCKITYTQDDLVRSGVAEFYIDENGDKSFRLTDPLAHEKLINNQGKK